MTSRDPSKEGRITDYFANLGAIRQSQTGEKEGCNFGDPAYIRAFCERTMKFPSFAPHCYQQLWTEVDPACAVTHLASYIESARELPKKEDRLRPLREFFESPRAGQIMQENIQSLIKSAYPAIEKYGWQKDLESIGLYVVRPDSNEVSIYFKGYKFHGSL
jgi:hypothetical protein